MEKICLNIGIPFSKAKYDILERQRISIVREINEIVVL